MRPLKSPTEAEIGDVLVGLGMCPELQSVVRRLAFQRDRLKESDGHFTPTTMGRITTAS